MTTTPQPAKTDAPLPEAVVMQMVMGAWASKVISDVTHFGVPDALESGRDPLGQFRVTSDSQKRVVTLAPPR